MNARAHSTYLLAANLYTEPVGKVRLLAHLDALPVVAVNFIDGELHECFLHLPPGGSIAW